MSRKTPDTIFPLDCSLKILPGAKGLKRFEKSFKKGEEIAKKEEEPVKLGRR